MSAPPPPAHALPAEEVCRRLGTDPRAGPRVRARPGAGSRPKGPTACRSGRRRARLQILARQFRNPMTLLLAGAARVSLAVGEPLDAVVIAAIVLLNALLGAIQEGRAEAAARAVRELLADSSPVVREGRPLELGSSEIVRGDVVLLAPGDRVPADGRLVEAAAAEVDESTLTGESLPVAKRAEPPDRTGSAAGGAGDRRARRHHGCARSGVDGRDGHRAGDRAGADRRAGRSPGAGHTAAAPARPVRGGAAQRRAGAVPGSWRPSRGHAARARRQRPDRGLARRRRRARGFARGDHGDARLGMRRLARAGRDRSPAARGGGARLGDGHLHRQDGHADREPDVGRPTVGSRRTHASASARRAAGLRSGWRRRRTPPSRQPRRAISSPREARSTAAPRGRGSAVRRRASADERGRRARRAPQLVREGRAGGACCRGSRSRPATSSGGPLGARRAPACCSSPSARTSSRDEDPERRARCRSGWSGSRTRRARAPAPAVAAAARAGSAR